jgi:uncharacterized protein (DUF983 family)
MDLGIHASDTATSFSQVDVAPVQPIEKGIRIFCPQGYEFQKKVEDIKGREYCREHCGKEYNAYLAMENTASCYWIAKGGK